MHLLKQRDFLLVSLLSLIISACGYVVAENYDDLSGIIDYDRSVIFDDLSVSNRLYIETTSRLTLKDGGQSHRYLLLHTHPRETTFQRVDSVYRDVIAEAKGASDITFIYSLDTKISIVSRRYSAAEKNDVSYLHECRGTELYQLKEPDELVEGEISRMTTFNDIRWAAGRSKKIYGKFLYMKDGREVILDFPVKLININPETRTNGAVIPEDLQWQAVSPLLPLYLGLGKTVCESIVPGYVAFRQFSGRQSVVYLCQASIDGKNMQDYICTTEIDGVVELYSRK